MTPTPRNQPVYPPQSQPLLEWDPIQEKIPAQKQFELYLTVLQMPALCGGNLLVLKQITVHLCGEGGSLWKTSCAGTQLLGMRTAKQQSQMACASSCCSLGIVTPDSTVLALLQHQNRWQDQNRCQEAKGGASRPLGKKRSKSSKSKSKRRKLGNEASAPTTGQCAANLMAHVPDWYRMNQPLHTMSLHNIRSHSRINPIVLLAHTNHTLQI